MSEPTKTIDKYLMEIVHELQTNLTSNQWRVRESCCGALQDLVRGRSLTGKKRYLLFLRIKKKNTVVKLRHYEKATKLEKISQLF